MAFLFLKLDSFVHVVTYLIKEITLQTDIALVSYSLGLSNHFLPICFPHNIAMKK